MDDLRETIQNYHISIRREIREQEIRNKRRIFIQDYETGKFQNQVSESSTSFEKMMEFSQRLKSSPSEDWRSVLHQLSHIITFEEDVKVWRDVGIIPQILQVFEYKYQELRLTSIASRIMNYYQMKGEKQPNLMVQFTQLVENNSIIQHLSRIMNASPLSQIIEELFFIGNIMSQNGYIRNQAVECGMAKTVLKHFKGDIQESQTSALTFVSAMLVKYYESPEQKLRYSIATPFVNIFIQVMKSGCKHSIKETVIDGLVSILTSELKHAHEILQLNGIPSIIQHANQEDIPSVCTWTLLSKICSNSSQSIKKEFINRGGIDTIEKILHEGCPELVNKKILSTVQSLIRNSGISADSIMRSDIMDDVFKGCSAQKLSTRMQSMRILCKVLREIRYSQMLYLLKRFDIVETTVTNLVGATDPNMKCECLDILFSLVLEYSNVKQESGSNSIVEILLESYKIDSTLMNLSGPQENRMVSERAQQLLELISKSIA